MKKTNISALLLAALLLIQLLCAPVSAVTAEPAADAQADAQTASDNSAEDAAAEADSVPEDQLLSSREQFSVAARPRCSSISTRTVSSMSRTPTSGSIPQALPRS